MQSTLQSSDPEDASARELITNLLPASGDVENDVEAAVVRNEILVVDGSNRAAVDVDDEDDDAAVNGSNRVAVYVGDEDDRAAVDVDDEDDDAAVDGSNRMAVDDDDKAMVNVKASNTDDDDRQDKKQEFIFVNRWVYYCYKDTYIGRAARLSSTLKSRKDALRKVELKPPKRILQMPLLCRELPKDCWTEIDLFTFEFFGTYCVYTGLASGSVGVVQYRLGVQYISYYLIGGSNSAISTNILYTLTKVVLFLDMDASWNA
ncbi:uncharacterized protein C8R40DRAFT_1075096 [Lentinula edodes]|uniref:uncharacterized protein n=1 Tax=Lentinula edodes TaxID=5353 RepID=UPI001E8CFE2C|nr:uncharacterized protein C8R40DRAFT_1075096 [Lentinula edodes]KAH7868110.1 hypothetical protein C8R40DRAFT_1075096 [Lentinula edodes]